MKRLIARIFFKLIGWKLYGDVPKDVGSCILIAAPHTSNWDWLIGLMGYWYRGINANILIKKEAFKGPAGWLLRALGAIPVDRSAGKGQMVKDLAEQLRQGKKMNVIVTPEGTRKKAKKWRTGFYYLALEANVPIIPCYIDYKHKRGGYGPPIYPTGDREYDFQQIRSFYENNDFEGKYPEQGSYNLVP